MEECRPAYTPLEPGIQLSKDDSPKDAQERERMSNIPYGELIGCLNYISQCTRPDITFVVTKLAHSSNPGYIHWTEAKRILRYLSYTLDTH